MTDSDRANYWEERAKIHEQNANYYREELTKAHALLGRVVHQTSERWDSLRLTEYFPTNNLHHTKGKP